jgi:hypothetical protein
LIYAYNFLPNSWEHTIFYHFKKIIKVARFCEQNFI